MTPEHLGLIPWMLDDHDKRPAREQFDEHYAHGGGWQPVPGFKMLEDHWLKYPGDPEPLVPRATCNLRTELIVFYDHAFVAIIQPDGAFEVARMD